MQSKPKQPKELKYKPAPLDHDDILGGINSSLYEDSWLNGTCDNSRNKQAASKYDASLDVTSRKGRTAVYSGTARSACYDYVPTLEELCLLVLKNNISMIQSVGLAPYHLIKPVLSKCSWSELKRIESYNKSLLEDTDELWEIHCKQEFQNQDIPKYLPEGRTWRKLFFRCVKSREEKLKSITHKMKKKAKKDAEPIKKTVAINAIAPKRGSAKSKMVPVARDASGPQASSTAATLKASAMQTRVAAARQTPKKAPLMAKTLQMFKQRYHGKR